LALNNLFEITRFSSFLEALVENSEYRLSLERAVAFLVHADQVPLVVRDWIAFWDNPRKPEGDSISQVAWSLLADFNTEEMQVILRWLLDRTVREFGSGERRKGRKDSLELLLILLHELSRDTPPEILTQLVEQYLPLTKDHAMASDLYQWLFSFSFDPDGPGMAAYLLAVQGLEKAKLSGDLERIGYSAYNLATYYSFYDASQSLAVLEEYLDSFQEDRYYDALGNIALKLLEERPSEKALAYLESVWFFTRRSAALEGGLAELRAIGFNLAYYAMNLAWASYDARNFDHALKILTKLKDILLKEHEGFLEAARDLGTHPVDWVYQYYAHLAETFLWIQACYEEGGHQAEAEQAQKEFEVWRALVPVDLEVVVQDFFRDRGHPDD
jgi:hypothetical protein